jgi:hypothetical protein
MNQIISIQYKFKVAAVEGGLRCEIQVLHITDHIHLREDPVRHSPLQ